jgi:hypothetical protein
MSTATASAASGNGSRLVAIFRFDRAKVHLLRGIAVVPLVVLAAIPEEKYWVRFTFAGAKQMRAKQKANKAQGEAELAPHAADTSDSDPAGQPAS